jgi:hypothetical protein
MVLPNDEQFLARGGIVSPRCVPEAAIPDVQAVDDGEAEGPLNDRPHISTSVLRRPS